MTSSMRASESVSASASFKSFSSLALPASASDVCSLLMARFADREEAVLVLAFTVVCAVDGYETSR